MGLICKSYKRLNSYLNFATRGEAAVDMFRGFSYELRTRAFFDRLKIVELLAVRITSNVLLHYYNFS